jgi:integrase
LPSGHAGDSLIKHAKDGDNESIQVHGALLGALLRLVTPISEFYPLLDRAGLSRVRFHDLRHTAATLQLGESHDLAGVSATLGHAQTSTTANIYAHALPSGRKQIAASIDRLLFS